MLFKTFVFFEGAGRLSSRALRLLNICSRTSLSANVGILMKPKSEPSQLARYRTEFQSREKPAPACRRLPAPASGPVPVPLGTTSREPRPSTSGCRNQSSPTQERRPSSSGCRNPPQTPTTPRLPHTCFTRSTAKQRKLPDELTPAYQQAALGKTYLALWSVPLPLFSTLSTLSTLSISCFNNC